MNEDLMTIFMFMHGADDCDTSFKQIRDLLDDLETTEFADPEKQERAEIILGSFRTVANTIRIVRDEPQI